MVITNLAVCNHINHILRFTNLAVCNHINHIASSLESGDLLNRDSK